MEVAGVHAEVLIAGAVGCAGGSVARWYSVDRGGDEIDERGAGLRRDGDCDGVGIAAAVGGVTAVVGDDVVAAAGHQRGGGGDCSGGEWEGGDAGVSRRAGCDHQGRFSGSCGGCDVDIEGDGSAVRYVDGCASIDGESGGGGREGDALPLVDQVGHIDRSEAGGGVVPCGGVVAGENAIRVASLAGGAVGAPGNAGHRNGGAGGNVVKSGRLLGGQLIEGRPGMPWGEPVF